MFSDGSASAEREVQKMKTDYDNLMTLCAAQGDIVDAEDIVKRSP